MRLVEGFYLREIAGEVLAVPTGKSAIALSGIATMNSTAAFLFEALKTDQTFDSLVKALCEQYEVDECSAKEDVKQFVDTLNQYKLIEE